MYKRNEKKCVYRKAIVSRCSPLAFNAAVVYQWIVLDHLLFGFVASYVQDIQRAHLRGTEKMKRGRNGQKKFKRRDKTFFFFLLSGCTVNWGVMRLSSLAAHSLSGDARTGSMKISGPINTTPSNAVGSFIEADSKIIPP